MISIVRTASALLAAGAVAIAAVPAAAADFEAERSVLVRHGDLDLTSDRGVAALQHRIKLAARSVCGTFHAADLSAKSRALACRGRAIANTTPKVELAVAAARSGQAVAGNAVAVGVSAP